MHGVAVASKVLDALKAQGYKYSTISGTTVAVVDALIPRLHIPHIIGMILAGVLIGEHGFHVLDRDSSFELFGKVGLYYIMFRILCVNSGRGGKADFCHRAPR